MKLELIRAFYDVDGEVSNEWQDEYSIKKYGYEYNGYVLAEKHISDSGMRFTSKQFECADDDAIKELDDALQKFTKQADEIKRVKNALQALYDVQNGPPLVTYTDEWNEAMEEAEKCLTEKAGE